MTPSMILLWVAVGSITGWGAGYVLKEGGYGLVGDISLGAIGAMVGSGLFLYLGTASPGLVVSLLIAFVGAAALIFAQHTFWAVPA